MDIYKVIKGSICAAIVSGLVLSGGCGQATKGLDSQDNMGTLSKVEKNPKGGALYQKYQGKFPENLMQITAEDYMKKWPNSGYVIQEADGTEVVAYSTAEAFKDVMDNVEESYPTFNEEEFLQAEADKIAETNHIMNATSLEGTGLTEEEIGEQLQEKLKRKLARISAEKMYMTVGELTSSEVQNKMMAQMQSIQQGIGFEIKDNDGTVVFTKKQTELLIDMAVPHSINLCANMTISERTVAVTLAVGMTIHDKYGEDNKGNSFVHSYWASLVGNSCDGIRWFSPTNGREWAYSFTAAREESRNAAGMMDLHNDRVGSEVYCEYADKNWDYIKIKIGWIKIKIPISYSTSSDTEGMKIKLKKMSDDAQKAWWGVPSTSDQSEQPTWHVAKDSVVRIATPSNSKLIYFVD